MLNTHLQINCSRKVNFEPSGVKKYNDIKIVNRKISSANRIRASIRHYELDVNNFNRNVRKRVLNEYEELQKLLEDIINKTPQHIYIGEDIKKELKRVKNVLDQDNGYLIRGTPDELTGTSKKELGLIDYD